MEAVNLAVGPAVIMKLCTEGRQIVHRPAEIRIHEYGRVSHPNFWRAPPSSSACRHALALLKMPLLLFFGMLLLLALFDQSLSAVPLWEPTYNMSMS